jgi:NDP-sugar pyrophosphorylase family protein
MKAGIIAAGEGSRLKSEGLSLAKPLVPVRGVPLIERLLLSFIRCGITDVVCIVNEQSLDVKEFVEGRKFGIPVRFVVKSTPSSMHSLFALAPHLSGERFLLSTVDSVFDEQEFSGFLRYAHGREDLDGLLAVTGFVDDENPLYVRLDDGRRIRGFSKSEATPWVTGGLYVFSPRIFRETDAALRGGIERLRNFLGHLVSSGYVFEGYAFSKIVDVDHVRDIRTAESLLRGRT